VTADGLTVDGNGSFSAGNVTLTLFETDTTDLNTRFRQNGGELLIRTTSDDGATDTTRMVIDHSTGDISFYEDTGTTPKFFWDASAESLGIGTTNPDTMLHLSSATNSQVLRFERTDTTVVADNPIGIIEFEHQDATDAGVAAKIEAAAENASGGVGLRFATGAPSSITERMRIDSNGNVDIKANITAAGPTLTLENTATAVNGQQWGAIHFKSNDSSTGASGTRASIVGTSTSFNGDGNITFSTAPASGSNTERMRIDSDGDVGIGSSTPTFSTGSGLEIQRTSATATLRLEYTGANGYEISAEQTQVTYNSVSSLPHVFEIGSSPKMTLDASGNLLVGTLTSPAAGTPKSVRYGQGVQAGTLSSEVSVTSGVTTTVIDMADAVPFTSVGSGLYLVSIVRQNGSYATNFVGVFGATTTAIALYSTIVATSMTVSVSGTNIQINASNSDTYMTNVIPLSIDG